MAEGLSASEVAARVENSMQPVISTLPKPPQSPSAAEQIAANPPKMPKGLGIDPQTWNRRS